MFSEFEFQNEVKQREDFQKELKAKLKKHNLLNPKTKNTAEFSEVESEGSIASCQYTHFYWPNYAPHLAQTLAAYNKTATDTPECVYGDFEEGMYSCYGHCFYSQEYDEQIDNLNFSYCEFIDFKFDDINFSSENTLYIKGASFVNTIFASCTFKRYQFKNCHFYNVVFQDCVLAAKPYEWAIFQNCVFSDCDFSNTTDMPGGTFWNCRIRDCFWPEFKDIPNFKLDYTTARVYNSVRALYEQLSKGYKASLDSSESRKYHYLSKKYALYSQFLEKDYLKPPSKAPSVIESFLNRAKFFFNKLKNFLPEVSNQNNTVNELETFALRAELFFTVLFKDPMSWINYYVIGFGQDPLRVLCWYAIFIVGWVLLWILGNKQPDIWDCLKLELDAIFTYGQAFVDSTELNPFQLMVFYGSSFVSLVLNGLFISTTFYYLTSED
ncbi:MAG: pentapeptide repeat-containing protein [Vampirovibrionales bacterium]|nr:pentapeptide repeat-containing protein [Vampirovibrionales bacterium]